MKTYVLPGITAERRQWLDEAGIPCEAWGEGNVLVVGDEHLDLAVNTLGATIVKRTEKDWMVEIVLQFDGENKAVKPTANVNREQVTPDQRAISRANYIKACASRLQQIKASAQKREMPVVEELRAAQTRLTEAARVAHFENLSPQEMEQCFREELQHIRTMPKVTDVTVTSGAIMLQTETLYATMPDGSARYELGQFAIWIRFSGDYCGVYWINRTRKVNGAKLGMQAPNVYANGTASNDAVKHVMHELIGRCEFSALADLAIQYVETINPEHPLAMYINKWPAAPLQTA